MVNHHDLPDGHDWFGLWIEPLDVLFFRDGQPFNASSRAEGGLPSPRTLAGAVRTAILAADGFDFRAFARQLAEGATIIEALENGRAPRDLIDARFRGPWLGQVDDRVSRQLQTLYLNPPANLYRIGTGDEVYRADPRPHGDEPPGWDAGTSRRPLWRNRSGKPRPLEEHLVTLEGIAEFLDGKDQLHGEHFVQRNRLYEFDHRVGVAIEPDSLTGADGQLFATRTLALREHIGFYAEMTWRVSAQSELESALSAPFPWGGEGRHAHAQVMDPIVWPPQAAPDPARESVYLLATPGVFATPAQPGPLDPDLLHQSGAQVVASASTGPFAVSGWDVARKVPRPTRFAAPAGTVYFAKNSKVPGKVSLCGDEELVTEGWGFALRGVIAHDR